MLQRLQFGRQTWLIFFWSCNFYYLVSGVVSNNTTYESYCPKTIPKGNEWKGLTENRDSQHKAHCRCVDRQITKGISICNNGCGNPNKICAVQLKSKPHRAPLRRRKHTIQRVRPENPEKNIQSNPSGQKIRKKTYNSTGFTNQIFDRKHSAAPQALPQFVCVLSR